MRITIAFIALLSPANASENTPGPICSGRELGITQWQAATEIADGICSGPSVADYATCHTQIAYGFATPESEAVLCGDLLELYESCVTQAWTTHTISTDCFALFTF